MGKTSIEWATDTWNPVTGCTKVSEGCRNCYAERVIKRFGERVHGLDQVPSYPDFIGPGDAETRAFTDVAIHPDRLDQPLHWRKPRRVFVCSMGDLFHEYVPDEFIAAVFGVMAACPQHTFIVLTKRPERMLKWFDWLKDMAEQTADANREPMRDLWTMHVMLSCARNYGSAVAGCRVEWPLPNVIGMVSVEDQDAANSRVPLLLQTPFAIRGVSYEPALGPVDLGRAHGLPIYREADVMADVVETVGKVVEIHSHRPGRGWVRHDGNTHPWLDWVICGGESGPGARPMHPDWARSLRDQCQAAGVPFFFKQWGEWAPPARAGEALAESQGRNEATDRKPFCPGCAVHRWPDGSQSWRIGKKAAGSEMDGRTHDEFPSDGSNALPGVQE